MRVNINSIMPYQNKLYSCVWISQSVTWIWENFSPIRFTVLRDRILHAISEKIFSKDKRKLVNFLISLSDQEDPHDPSTESLPICTRGKTQKLPSVRLVELRAVPSFTVQAYYTSHRQWQMRTGGMGETKILNENLFQYHIFHHTHGLPWDWTQSSTPA